MYKRHEQMMPLMKLVNSYQTKLTGLKPLTLCLLQVACIQLPTIVKAEIADQRHFLKLDPLLICEPKLHPGGEFYYLDLFQQREHAAAFKPPGALIGEGVRTSIGASKEYEVDQLTKVPIPVTVQ